MCVNLRACSQFAEITSYLKCRSSRSNAPPTPQFAISFCTSKLSIFRGVKTRWFMAYLKPFLFSSPNHEFQRDGITICTTFTPFKPENTRLLARKNDIIGLYRDVWIAAIAPSRTRLATLTGAMCKTSQCELRSLRVNSGMLNVIRIVTYYTLPPLQSPDSFLIAMAISR